MRSAGYIVEEECCGDKHVEWDVDYASLPQERDTDERYASRPEESDSLISPVLIMGEQLYRLELRSNEKDSSSVEVRLLRLGPSVQLSLRWFAGIKRGDGSYHQTIESGYLDLTEKCKPWRCVQDLGTFLRSELKELHTSRDKKLTFFLRLDADPEQDKSCTHDSTRLTPSSKGRIREEEFGCHKQVEWDLDPAFLAKDVSSITSPVFIIGTQRYILELRDNTTSIALRFFRSGPWSPGERVRCFAGIKCGDGVYYHRIEVRYFDMYAKCELWRQEPFDFSWKSSEISQNLNQNGSLTFFCRMNVENMCSHGVVDLCPRTTGSISEEPWDSYKQVEWDVDYERSSRLLASPIFHIDDQAYIWQLSYASDHLTVELFRAGPSVKRYVRWWSIMNYHGGTNQGCETKYAQMDLEIRTYVTWRTVDISFRFPYSGERIHLAICFLMSLERRGAEEMVSTEIFGETQNLRREQISFLVQGEEMRLHRAILSIRSPVLKAMFSHDTLENRTGVVHIKDCDPFTFRSFLNFIEKGDKFEVYTSDPMALYAVAEKYLVDDLKAECLGYIKDTLRMETFFGVVQFAVLHKVDDLLNEASSFLVLHADIINTKAWDYFYSNNTAAAKILLLKAFPPEGST